jgi:hypothetical protein
MSWATGENKVHWEDILFRWLSIAIRVWMAGIKQKH